MLKIGNGLDLQSQKISNLADAVSNTDAVTLQQLLNYVNGLNYGPHVRAVATTNISVTSAPSTIDGLTGAAADRFLLTAQTAPAENGPWVYTTSGAAMTRPADYTTALLPAKSSRTYAATEGTWADKAYTMQTDVAVTVGTTSTAWALVTSGLTYVAGAGLTLTGSTFDVVALDGSITVAADTITVGNVPVAKGGTGATTAVAGLAALGGVGKFAANITTVAATPLSVNHGLGTTDVTVTLWDNQSGTGNMVLADVAQVDSTHVTVTTAAIFTGRIVVTG